jgi:AraC-like DNA-binding protein
MSEAALTWVQLDSVTVHRIRTAPLAMRRPGAGPYRLVLAMRGCAVVRQQQREARLTAGDIAFYDSSRPFHAGTDGDVDLFVVGLPADAVPVGPGALESLLGVRLPGPGRMAQVLTAVLCQLTAAPEAPPPADAARLSTVVLELVRGVVAAGPAAARAADPAGALLVRIDEFVHHHLDDPDLTPARIAAAHHISVRRLQQVFQRQGRTVAGWIRRRRLDACRQDLADPLLDDRPVHAIAARWGFVDQSHFGRVFRAAFGAPPAAWRHTARGRAILAGGPAHDSQRTSPPGATTTS